MRLGEAIHRLNQRLSDFYATGKTDLTLTQVMILAALRDHGAMHQTQMVERTGIDRSTISDTIRRLQARDLLTAAWSIKDGRARTVTITKAGSKALRRAQKDLEFAEDQVLALVAHAQQGVFLATVRAAAGGANG